MLDPLESRMLLSADAGAAMPFMKVQPPVVATSPVLNQTVAASVSKGGTLTILGTDEADEITILKGRGKNFSVMSGGDGVLSFKANAVKRIVAWLGAEGDDLSLWDLPTPATVMAGAGDDLIVGSGGADSLYGGLGSDSLEGGAGDDRLFGEEGNDTLNGGRGHDAVTGGTGNNTWVASIGQDYKLDIFDYEDTHGWTRAPEELPAGAVTLKATTLNGLTTLRMVVMVPTLSYQVDFGAFTRNDSVFGSQGYDAILEASLPLEAGGMHPAETSFKTYHELGELPSGTYSVRIYDFRQNLVDVVKFAV